VANPDVEFTGLMADFLKTIGDDEEGDVLAQGYF